MWKFKAWPLRSFIGILTIVAVSIGCGGGGGGGGTSSRISLTINTDWSNRAAAGQITGGSQRLSLFQGDNVIDSAVVNAVDTVSMTKFSNLSSGNYRLLAQLFAGSSASGSQTGIFERRLAVSSNITLTTEVGGVIAEIVTEPANSSVQIPRTETFAAFARTSAGVATFVGLNDVSWSQLGDKGTIDSSTGVFTATVSGEGAVRATHVPTGRLASSTVSVQPFTTARSKWTVMVFLNAANDLSPFDVANINQMERVTNNDVRFVVQWKQVFDASFDPTPSFVGTRRYLVKPDQTSSIASDLVQDMGLGVDMGSTTTSRDFIDWAKANYPADRYAFIFWNHGNGWLRSLNRDVNDPSRGVSYDDELGTSIKTHELTQALGNNVFDIVAWDSSLMQMMEVAYEIKDKALYVVGSEESPPGEGYPYDLVFGPWAANPSASTETLSRSFVDGMIAAYPSRKITQSVIKSSELENLQTAISNLGSAIKTVIDNESTDPSSSASVKAAIVTARNTAQKYGSVSNDRSYRDLYDWCLKLEASTGVPTVVNSSAVVRQRILDSLVYERHNSNSPNSNGISIWIPTGTAYNGRSSDYSLLRFSISGQWDEMLDVLP